MDRRRYRTGLIAALIGAFAAFSFAAYAVQGGPVYQSVPTHPTPGVTACSGNRVWINKDDGTQYCCISSTWQVCPLFLRLPSNTPGSPAASDMWYDGSGLVMGGGLSTTGAVTVGGALNSNSLAVTNLATVGSLSTGGAVTASGFQGSGSTVVLNASSGTQLATAGTSRWSCNSTECAVPSGVGMRTGAFSCAYGGASYAVQCNAGVDYDMSLGTGRRFSVMEGTTTLFFTGGGANFEVRRPFVIGLSGTAISKSVRGTLTVDLASISAGTCASDQAVTVTGAAAGADCVVGPPSALPASLTTTCYVSATDTAQLRVCNVSAGSVDPGSLTYAVRVFNP